MNKMFVLSKQMSIVFVHKADDKSALVGLGLGTVTKAVYPVVS